MMRKLRTPISLFLSVWMILLCFGAGASAMDMSSNAMTDTVTETVDTTEGSTAAPAETETQIGVTDAWFMEEETLGDLRPGSGEPEASVQTSTTDYLLDGKIPDGVYAIRHFENPELWVDIRYNRTTPGGYVQQYDFGRSPALGTSEQLGLYKITQTGEDNRYIVRLMLNQSLTFTIDADGYVITKTIPLDDASVLVSDTWYINYYSGGYTFRPADGDPATLECMVTQSDTASGSGGGDASRLISGQMHLVGNDCKWILEGRTCHIDDGVYCLENVGNTDRWMDVQYNSIEPEHYIQQYAYTCFPTTSVATANANRGGLFKISEVGDTGRYVIRLMTNNRLGICFDGTSVKTKTIPDNDNLVPESDTFNITFQNGTYVIRQSSSLVSANVTTASGSSGAPDSYLVRGTLSTIAAIGNQSKWKMFRYGGNDFMGMDICCDDPSWESTGIVAGDVGTIRMISWTTMIQANTPYMEIDSVSSNMAHATWNASSGILTLTADAPGRLQISTDIKDASTNENVVGNRTKAYWVIPQEGIYYIQNAGTERYMDIEGPSTASGADIQQWDFSTANQKKWTVEHVSGSGGYVRLKSVYSGLYVGVNSANTAQIIQTATQDDYTLWRVALTSAKNVKLTCKATNDVLAVPLNENDNGTDLTQLDYTNDTNYRDEWYLYAVNRVLNEVPTNLSSNSTHYCIPCAITNVAAYWCVNGYSGFDCADAESQEEKAIDVQASMVAAGSCKANAYIQDGFDVFSHMDGSTEYILNSENLWRGSFTVKNVLSELNAGRPLLLGFAGTNDSPYGGAHMTVCVGYEIRANSTVYVYVSDAHSDEYTVCELKLDTYNDFIATVCPNVQP